jgi:hypothetical protein
MCRELTILNVSFQHTSPSHIVVTSFYSHNLLSHLLSMYSLKLMQFGDVSYTGEHTTECFAHGGLTQAQLMDDCVHCLAYDDQVDHPDSYGYRIFLGPRISVCHSHSKPLILNLSFYTCLQQSMYCCRCCCTQRDTIRGLLVRSLTWITL